MKISNDLLDAALDLQRFCKTNVWQMCFIGGLAVQRWGEPRFTKDADLTLLTGFGNEEEYVDKILNTFVARVENPRVFALRSRVLLLRHPNGIFIDIGLGGLPFEEHTIERASTFEFSEEHELITCSAEDLIVHKAFANRPQDWLDVETILMRQREKLNLQIVWEELTPLVELKEEPQILDRLRNLVNEILGTPINSSLLAKPPKSIQNKKRKS